MLKALIMGNEPGILQHNVDGGFLDSPEKAEIEKITSSSTKVRREEANKKRLADLEWYLSLYRKTGPDGREYPDLPTRCVRSSFHGGSKLSRSGQQLNRSMIITKTEFDPCADGRSIDELMTDPDYRHSSVVRVGQQRVMRTRAKFPEWKCWVWIQLDENMTDMVTLREWIKEAGKYIGIGDWRPDKGGEWGRYELVEMNRVAPGG